MHTLHRKAVLIAMLLLTSARGVHAHMTVSVLSPPESPGGLFTAAMVGGAPGDRDLNPCYQQQTVCEIKMFAVPVEWSSGIPRIYQTSDEGSYTTDLPATEYRTLGEWYAAVRNKSRTATDYVPTEHGLVGCVVLAAATYTSGHWDNIPGAPNLSNCAKGIVQAPTCTLRPNTIMVELNVQQGSALDVVREVPGISLSCTTGGTVKIETNTNEEIPLSGSNDYTAVLDWGAGWGQPREIPMKDRETVPIPLRVSVGNIGLAPAGVLSGSTVINVSYQ